MHKREGQGDGEGDEQERNAAEMKNIAEKEARAEQDDPGFEPELVSGYAGLKDARDTGSVSDDEADDDGPENVFDVGEGDVVGLGVGGDGLLDELSGVADGGQQKQAGDEFNDAACEAG